MVKIKGMGWAAKVCSALCELQQVTEPLWASLSFPVRQEGRNRRSAISEVTQE